MSIVIVGAGACGLATALLLARDGHDVTVLERDAEPAPSAPIDAWDAWARKGVAQFRQPHNLMPGLRLLLEAELPDVQAALARAGAVRYDLIHPLPPLFSDRSPRPIDAQLWTYTGRRPVLEWAFAEAARAQAGLTIRRGCRVAGLLTGPRAHPEAPHVTGVRLESGEELTADLVVDATGRGSRSTAWLTALGARPPLEEHMDSGFTYYTRYFTGTTPERRGASLTAIGSFSLLTLLGDNGTWSVTVFTSSGDQPLKSLRHEAVFTRVVRACPLHAHWLDGTPITGVLPMSGIVDRYRRFCLDGVPVATGFVAVADAWACTNPSAGRGLTVGVLHALRLRNALRQTSRPAELVETFDRLTESEITPWYRAQIAYDRVRFAEMEAHRDGRPPAPPADPLGRGIAALFAAMMTSPALFRHALEYIATITPVQDILRRPQVAEGLQAARQSMTGPPPLFGPPRAQLLQLMQEA